MDNGIKKIKDFTITEISENKIHIIVRTHLRESYFKKVIESIVMQNYENYIIHVAYDHIDSLDYINQNMNHKMMIHKVERRSDKNVFFDLYCNDIKDKINDGWIMFLDDDNYFIYPDCLKIINMNLKEKIVVWSFLRPDKLITPNFDKGLFFKIPFNGFLGTSSRSNYTARVRPIQRDGGQYLEDFMGRIWWDLRDARYDAFSQSMSRLSI